MSPRAGRRTTTALAAAAGTLLLGLVAGAVPAAGAPAPTPAAIALRPDCGTAPPFRFHVSGTDFNPFNDVLVTFDAGAGGRPESFGARTDGFGRFELDVQVQPRPAGTYLVRADDFRQREATANFTVPCVVATPTPTPTPTPVTFAAKIDIFPKLGPPGFVARVTGTGFPHGQLVTLVWDRGLMSIPQGQVTSGDDGTFAIDLLIFHHDVRGTRILAAAPGPGAKDTYPAPKTDFLVVPGTLQPGSFTERR